MLHALLQVTDYRNDVILAAACREDVEKFCKDTEPGMAAGWGGGGGERVNGWRGGEGLCKDTEPSMAG